MNQKLERKALVVGINKYPFLRSSERHKYQHLLLPANDAEGIAEFLDNVTGSLEWDVKRLPEIPEPEENKYKLNSEGFVSKQQFTEAITELLHIGKTNNIPDVVMLFFSGHGLRKKYENGKTEGFLATSDTFLEKGELGISLTWLREKLLESPVKKQIIWLDCCHSGELLEFLNKNELEDLIKIGNRSLIAACRSDTFASGIGEYGVLTRVLLKALDPKLRPKEQWITSKTVTDFVKNESSTNKLLKRQGALCEHFGGPIKFWQGIKPSTQTHWGEAPDVSVFFGRKNEILELEQWIIKDRCRVVGIVGMRGIGKTQLSVKLGQGGIRETQLPVELVELRQGGIGKTDFSLKLAQEIEDKFEFVIWQTLRNAPSIKNILADLIKFLSSQQEKLSDNDTIEARISKLLQYFKEHRCLVILDNVESVLKPGDQAGQYQKGYEEYGQFFQRVCKVNHKSCLLFTSREKPQEIARLAGEKKPIRFKELKGLEYLDAQKIFL